jgi:hypothetical protein
VSSQAYTQWQRTFLRAVRALMDVTNGLLLQLYGAIQAENAALVTHRDKVAAFLEVSRRLKAVSEVSQWQAWDDRPWDVPSTPNVTYADEGWVSLPDWLGYGEGKPKRGTSL